MNVRAVRLRLLPPLAAAALLSGCGSVTSFFSSSAQNSTELNVGANPRPVARPAANPSEKPKVLPVASQDIACPPVDIVAGGSALRAGGPDNASVRYQFSIGDTARQCDPAGPQQAALKIGVSGELVIGPAGSAGTFSAPLKITVRLESDKKEVFSQTYKVEATSDGIAAGRFQIVTEPIILPLTTLQLADVYSISVGFEGGAPGPSAPRHQRRRRAG
jgi:hypothetical protein